MRKLARALIAITGVFDLNPIPQLISVRVSTRERQIENMLRLQGGEHSSPRSDFPDPGTR